MKDRIREVRLDGRGFTTSRLDKGAVTCQEKLFSSTIWWRFEIYIWMRICNLKTSASQVYQSVVVWKKTKICSKDIARNWRRWNETCENCKNSLKVRERRKRNTLAWLSEDEVIVNRGCCSVNIRKKAQKTKSRDVVCETVGWGSTIKTSGICMKTHLYFPTPRQESIPTLDSFLWFWIS